MGIFSFKISWKTLRYSIFRCSDTISEAINTFIENISEKKNRAYRRRVVLWVTS